MLRPTEIKDIAGFFYLFVYFIINCDGQCNGRAFLLKHELLQSDRNLILVEIAKQTRNIHVFVPTVLNTTGM